MSTDLLKFSLNCSSLRISNSKGTQNRITTKYHLCLIVLFFAMYLINET